MSGDVWNWERSSKENSYVLYPIGSESNPARVPIATATGKLRAPPPPLVIRYPDDEPLPEHLVIRYPDDEPLPEHVRVPKPPGRPVSPIVAFMPYPRTATSPAPPTPQQVLVAPPMPQQVVVAPQQVLVAPPTPQQVLVAPPTPQQVVLAPPAPQRVVVAPHPQQVVVPSSPEPASTSKRPWFILPHHDNYVADPGPADWRINFPFPHNAHKRPDQQLLAVQQPAQQPLVVCGEPAQQEWSYTKGPTQPPLVVAERPPDMNQVLFTRDIQDQYLVGLYDPVTGQPTQLAPGKLITH